MKKILYLVFTSVFTSVLSIFALIGVTLFAVIAPFVSFIVKDDGIYNNYSDWKQVEVPTDSTPKAKVRLPEDWYFFSDGERIYIKDEDGKIIATEVYEDWRISYTVSYQDGTKEKFDNKDEIDINKNLPKELQDLDAYKPYRVGEGSCYLYKAETEERDYYALIMVVVMSNKKNYNLMLVFNDDTVSDKDFKKIQLSYRYGGFVE